MVGSERWGRGGWLIPRAGGAGQREREWERVWERGGVAGCAMLLLYLVLVRGLGGVVGVVGVGGVGVGVGVSVGVGVGVCVHTHTHM
jgi:hypothetical protein